MTPPPARCRVCPAPIRWARTTNGRPIPLDYDPDPAGNVKLTVDDPPDPTAHVLNAGQAARAREDGEELFMPHHATCPGWKR